MKKRILALLTLCLLVCAVGHAESARIVKNAFKVTFMTADFKENWGKYAGPDALPPDASNPRYCLRLYVLDAAATDKYDKLSYF